MSCFVFHMKYQSLCTHFVPHLSVPTLCVLLLLPQQRVAVDRKYRCPLQHLCCLLQIGLNWLITIRSSLQLWSIIGKILNSNHVFFFSFLYLKISNFEVQCRLLYKLTLFSKISRKKRYFFLLNFFKVICNTMHHLNLRYAVDQTNQERNQGPNPQKSCKAYIDNNTKIQNSYIANYSPPLLIPASRNSFPGASWAFIHIFCNTECPGSSFHLWGLHSHSSTPSLCAGHAILYNTV